VPSESAGLVTILLHSGALEHPPSRRPRPPAHPAAARTRGGGCGSATGFVSFRKNRVKTQKAVLACCGIGNRQLRGAGRSPPPVLRSRAAALTRRSQAPNRALNIYPQPSLPTPALRVFSRHEERPERYSESVSGTDLCGGWCGREPVAVPGPCTGGAGMISEAPGGVGVAGDTLRAPRRWCRVLSISGGKGRLPNKTKLLCFRAALKFRVICLICGFLLFLGFRS